jgi:hypothetical protein
MKANILHVGLAISAMVSPAYSLPLYSTGYSTYDPQTGLEWLNLSQTQGQSYNSIVGGYGGYLANGWTYATTANISTLFDNAIMSVGGSPIGNYSDGNARPEYSMPAAYLGAALGFTYRFDNSSFFGWGEGITAKEGSTSPNTHMITIYQSNQGITAPQIQEIANSGVLLLPFNFIHDDIATAFSYANLSVHF